MTTKSDQHAKEIAFHDHAAEILTPDDVDADTFFDAPTAMENVYILSRMGPLEGKCVLDLGCGTGEATLNFARRGAKTSFCDISPKMVEFVNSMAGEKGLSVDGTTCAAEELSFPDKSFDYVYMNGVLHHVADRDKAYQEIRRVLRPGGMFFAVEPLVGNPAIWVYRRMATKMRSDDEAPLALGEIGKIAKYFPQCGYRTFWLS